MGALFLVQKLAKQIKKVSLILAQLVAALFSDEKKPEKKSSPGERR